jgi:uncharacterized protein YjaZ
MSIEKPPASPDSVVVAVFENASIEQDFLGEIAKSYDELRGFLPKLPKTMKLYFGTNYDYGESGVTGSAVGVDAIKIGIDPNVESREKQHNKIRSIVFHEGYHVSQGFYLGREFSALESAVYEGCATVFERDYAGSTPKWGDYLKEGKEKLLEWYDSMKSITAEQYFEPSGETWNKWAFYDPETDESWRVYKVGTWIVDDVMKKTGLTVVELNDMTAEQILKLWH